MGGKGGIGFEDAVIIRIFKSGADFDERAQTRIPGLEERRADSIDIPGLQVANIITANPDFLASIKHVMDVWEHGELNQLGIVALEAAYSPEGEEWLNQMNGVVHGNFLLLRDRFAEEFPQVRVATLEATYLDWLDFAPVGLTGKQIQDHLLEHEKLWINAGDIYGDPNCMRINLACPRSTMKKALDLYCRGLHELLG